MAPSQVCSFKFYGIFQNSFFYGTPPDKKSSFFWCSVSASVYAGCFIQKHPRRCSVRKGFLEISQNSQENTCKQSCKPLAQVFSCECREISKNTFFIEHLWATVSVLYGNKQFLFSKPTTGGVL